MGVKPPPLPRDYRALPRRTRLSVLAVQRSYVLGALRRFESDRDFVSALKQIDRRLMFPFGTLKIEC